MIIRIHGLAIKARPIAIKARPTASTIFFKAFPTAIAAVFAAFPNVENPDLRASKPFVAPALIPCPAVVSALAILVFAVLAAVFSFPNPDLMESMAYIALSRSPSKEPPGAKAFLNLPTALNGAIKFPAMPKVTNLETLNIRPKARVIAKIGATNLITA